MPGPEGRRIVTVEFNDGARQDVVGRDEAEVRAALQRLQREQGARTFVVVADRSEAAPMRDAGIDAGPSDAGPDDASRTVDAARRVQRVYGTSSAYADRPSEPRSGGMLPGMTFEPPEERVRRTVENPVTGERVTFESWSEEDADAQADSFLRDRQREQRALEMTGSHRLPGKASDVPMSRYPSDEMLDASRIRPGAKR